MIAQVNPVTFIGGGFILFGGLINKKLPNCYPLAYLIKFLKHT